MKTKVLFFWLLFLVMFFFGWLFPKAASWVCDIRHIPFEIIVFLVIWYIWFWVIKDQTADQTLLSRWFLAFNVFLAQIMSLLFAWFGFYEGQYDITFFSLALFGISVFISFCGD